MNCLDNLKVCKASCCKQVSFKVPLVNGSVPDGDIIMKTVSEGRKYYLKLHGIEVKRLPDRSFRIVIPHTIISWTRVTPLGKCEALLEFGVRCSELSSDNKCNLHGTVHKPKCCYLLDESNAHLFNLTEGCIYKKSGVVKSD